MENSISLSGASESNWISIINDEMAEKKIKKIFQCVCEYALATEITHITTSKEKKKKVIRKKKEDQWAILNLFNYFAIMPRERH